MNLSLLQQIHRIQQKVIIEILINMQQHLQEHILFIQQIYLGYITSWSARIPHKQSVDPIFALTYSGVLRHIHNSQSGHKFHVFVESWKSKYLLTLLIFISVKFKCRITDQRIFHCLVFHFIVVFPILIRFFRFTINMSSYISFTPSRN